MNSMSARILIFAIVLLAVPGVASAATLSLSSGSGTVGRTLSVSVLVSADSGESINGVSATIQYPPDKLSLQSISKAGSVISFWAEEPSFSNSAGIATVEGIIPNPGYTGQGGRVVTLVFQVLTPGEATISFGTSSVLANDGRGTNILDGAFSRTIVLNVAAQPPPAPTPTPDPRPKPAPTPPPQTPATTESVATTTDVVTSATTTEQLVLFEPSWATRVGIALLYVLAAVGLLAFIIAAYIGVTRLLAAERKRQREQKNIIDRSFDLLKSDIEKHITALRESDGDRALTKKEVAFLESFEDDLETVEDIVRKRLKD